MCYQPLTESSAHGEYSQTIPKRMSGQLWWLVGAMLTEIHCTFSKRVGGVWFPGQDSLKALANLFYATWDRCILQLWAGETERVILGHHQDVISLNGITSLLLVGNQVYSCQRAFGADTGEGLAGLNWCFYPSFYKHWIWIHI